MTRSINPPAGYRRMRRRLLRAGAASFGAALFPALAARAQDAAPAIARTDLGGRLLLLEVAGCNVLALRGADGALMIGGGPAATARALVDAVLAATGSDRIALLVDTDWHREQTGANELVGRAGGVIFAHENTKMYLSHTVYERTADDRLVPVPPLPEAARPTRTTRGEGTLAFAGRRIAYGYLPAAHTDGDLFLRFTAPDVLAAGGVVSGERWPLIDYRDGAWYGGRVRALQRLAALVGPDTRVVPAQGRLITGRDLVRQRDIYLDLFQTFIGYMNKGLGIDNVVALNPLKGYESEFGDAKAFLDGAYRSMMIAYVPD